MPNVSNSNNQIVFLQTESAFGAIPNSSGTATVANANACRVISASFSPATGEIGRPDKNQNLTETVGSRGRSMGSGSLSASLAGSGAPGTAPDIGPLLAALFGQNPTIVAATSVTYNLLDASPSVSIFNYRDPSTMDQQIALGSVVQSAKLTWGGDVATIEFTTESVYVLSSAAFSVSDATQKGGLTAFPARPSAPAYNGNFAVGFTGAISLDGSSYVTARSGSITWNMNRSLRKNLFNSYYPGPAQQQRRAVMFDIDLDDDDSAAMNTLKQKAISKATIAATIQIGTVAGNIWTCNFPYVQLPSYSYDDGQPTWGISLKGCNAKGTNKDECTLVLT